jgi:hypothetical protein
MSDIQTALDTIKGNLDKRQLYTDYYEGNHNLAFATEKFKSAFGRTLKGMRDNLCPIVVDALADRMEVINFSGEKEDQIATEAWKLWQREQMELVSNDTHKAALKTGCGYVIVWEDEGEAKFYLQDSRNCAVIVDEDTAKPLFAAKMWDVKVEADTYVRLNLYYADRIEKYITAKKKPTGVELKERHFTPAEEGQTENPYGVIPMFRFETQCVLVDAIPLQDALNKTFADRMVTQEFASFRQRWATGLEPPTDELTGVQKKLFDGGADKLWFTNEPTVKFGDFEASAIDPFLKAADSDRLEMARVTGTPLHFFSINTSDAISGEALKTLESRFTKKVIRLCLNFGTEWAKAMKFALAIEKRSTGTLTTQWAPAEQRSEKEGLEAAEVKQRLGIPPETLWEELGYSAEDVKKFSQEKEQRDKEKAAEMAMSKPMEIRATQ